MIRKWFRKLEKPRKESKRDLFSAVIFIALSVIYLFPVVLHPTSYTFGYFGDKMGVIRALEWGRPMFLNQPALLVPILLLAKITAPFTVYNIIILLSFPLTCFFAFRFFRRFFGPHLAFVLALAFTFSPYHLYKIYNHVDLAQIWVFPLCFSALLDFDREMSSRNALKLGGVLALATLTSNYYGYFLLLITACFFIIRTAKSALNGKNGSFLIVAKSYLLLVTSYLLLTLPFLLPYIRVNYLGEDLARPGGRTLAVQRGLTDFVAFSARPWYFVVPPVNHPVLGKMAQSIYDRLSGTGYFLFDDFFWEEHSAVFLGWANLTLAGFAVLKALRSRHLGISNSKFLISKTEEGHTKQIRTFFWLAIILAFLSGPPFFTIAGLKVYLPSYVLMKLFPMFRTLSRLGAPILLCVLVLAGYGLQFLSQMLSFSHSEFISGSGSAFQSVATTPATKPPVATIVTTCYLLLTLFEFSLPLQILPVPPRDSVEYYQLLLEEPGSFPPADSPEPSS